METNVSNMQHLNAARLKIKNIFTSVKNVKEISLVKQISSIGVWAWLGSLLLITPFVLYHYLSPVVMKMALEPVVAPIAGLFMVLLGEFDLSKLSTAMSSNAGLILKIGGTLTVVLFIQNCLKSALFLQSLRPLHKEYLAYSLAGIFTPISTVGVMYTLFSFGLLIKLQTVILAFLAIFVAEGAGEAIKAASLKMQMQNSINLTDLQTILSFVSNGIRVGLGILLTLWVILIAYLYTNIHKVLHYLFSTVINFNFIIIKNISTSIKNKTREMSKPFFSWYLREIGGPGTLLTAALVLIAVAFVWFIGAITSSNKVGGAYCAKSTMSARYDGKDLVLLDLKNKRGKCYDSDDAKKLAASEPFVFEGKLFYGVVLKESYAKEAKDKYGSTYVQMYDGLLDKNEIVWAIQPKTFLAKGLQPEDFPDFSKVEKIPKREVEKLEEKK